MPTGMQGGSNAKQRETKSKGVEKRTAKAPVKALKKKVVELKAKAAEKKEAKKVKGVERKEKWLAGDGGKSAREDKRVKEAQETIWD